MGKLGEHAGAAGNIADGDHVVDALSVLGEDYQAILRQAREERWIDVYENEGKSAGAYSWGTYGTHPYVLLNYKENLDSVLTIAHEMGHSVHTYLSNRHQPYLLSLIHISAAFENAADCAIFMHCLPSYHDLGTEVGREIYEKFGLTEICLLYTSRCV